MAQKEKVDNENLNRKGHMTVKGTYQKQTGHRCRLFFPPSFISTTGRNTRSRRVNVNMFESVDSTE